MKFTPLLLALLLLLFFACAPPSLACHYDGQLCTGSCAPNAGNSGRPPMWGGGHGRGGGRCVAIRSVDGVPHCACRRHLFGRLWEGASSILTAKRNIISGILSGGGAGGEKQTTN
ncbi:hypothetical protein TYRP_020015 [Tyrophagus putrescentiae]|nr:hypothetical protein TYRP_020015 [Tyrophagus putrescentiae]